MIYIRNFVFKTAKSADYLGNVGYDLYLRRHDRINNWDLVDRAAPHVVGEYLVDNDRSVLDRLATSAIPTDAAQPL